MASHNSAPSADNKDVKCKDCGRLLGTIEPTGLVRAVALSESCSTCQQFEPLISARDVADEAFEVLKGRRKEHKGREAAVEAMNAAHMALDNWLMLVEAPPVPTPDQHQRQDSTPHEEGREVDQGPGQHQGTKRPRSSTSPRSSAKRPQFFRQRSRVSFDKSVEFREDEYRKDATYNRISEEYVRGRHAPAVGSEFLDTSGHSLPITKFFGGKWVRGKWVNMRKGGEEGDEQEMKVQVPEMKGGDGEAAQGDLDVRRPEEITTREDLQDQQTETLKGDPHDQPTKEITSHGTGENQETPRSGSKEEADSAKKDTATPNAWETPSADHDKKQTTAANMTTANIEQQPQNQEQEQSSGEDPQGVAIENAQNASTSQPQGITRTTDDPKLPDSASGAPISTKASVEEASGATKSPSEDPAPQSTEETTHPETTREFKAAWSGEIRVKNA